MMPQFKFKKTPTLAANSTKSFWRHNVGGIDQHRTTETLPLEADIVIVGAGYSGASTAHHLIETSLQHGKPAPSIVILEAREACSGATGRNGEYQGLERLNGALTWL